MQKFTFYILKIVVTVVTLLFVLDAFYTFIHVKKGEPRNKVQYLQTIKNKQFDYIFLGSSRVLNGVDETVFSDKKVLNLGMLGQTLNETKLMLDILNEYNINANTICIQIDGDSGVQKESTLSTYAFVPLLDIDKVKTHFKNNNYDETLINIPFARYMNYGHKFGLRELCIKILKKQSALSFGFSPLQKNDKITIQPYIFKEENIPSKEQLQTLIETGNTYNMKIRFFTAPYYQAKNSKLFDKIKNEFNILYYGNMFTDKNYFYDPIHLNSEGSNKFTKTLIQELDANN